MIFLRTSTDLSIAYNERKTYILIQLEIISTPVGRVFVLLLYFFLSTVAFILQFLYANDAYIKVYMPQ